MDGPCDVVQRRFGGTIGITAADVEMLHCHESAVHGTHGRAHRDPLGVLGAVEQRLGCREEGDGRYQVDREHMRESFGAHLSDCSLLPNDGRVGDDNVELFEALALDVFDGLEGVRCRDGLDLYEDEPRALSGGELVKAIGFGGSNVTDAADDDVVGAGEVFLDKTKTEAWICQLGGYRLDLGVCTDRGWRQ